MTFLEDSGGEWINWWKFLARIFAGIFQMEIGGAECGIVNPILRHVWHQAKRCGNNTKSNAKGYDVRYILTQNDGMVRV